MWNMSDTLTKPETFAKIFCYDLDIPVIPWADTVANQIRAQLEEHESVAALELGLDGAMDVDATLPNAEELPECRVILSVSLLNYRVLTYLYSHIHCRSMSRLPTTILWTILNGTYSPLSHRRLSQRNCAPSSDSQERLSP